MLEGRISDGGVFNATSLYQALEDKALKLPSDSALPGRHPSNKSPFVILGDDAFPLKTYLMKPFSAKNLSDEKRIFNYRGNFVIVIFVE